jgi:hypothetical protein
MLRHFIKLIAKFIILIKIDILKENVPFSDEKGLRNSFETFTSNDLVNLKETIRNYVYASTDNVIQNRINKISNNSTVSNYEHEIKMA